MGLGSLRRRKEGVSVPCVGGLGSEQIIKLSLNALRKRGQLASGRRRAQVQREHRRRAPRRLVLASQPDRTSEEVRGERGRRTCPLRGEPVEATAEEYRMKPELTAPAEDEGEDEARVSALDTLSTFIVSTREHVEQVWVERRFSPTPLHISVF